MSQASPDAASKRAQRAADHYRAQLETVYAGRRFVAIGGPVAALAGLAASLQQLGAERTFLLGSCMGAGEPPGPSQPWHSLEQRANSVREEFRRYESALRNLPVDARNALDRFDPDRAALAIGAVVLSDVPDVGGRGRFGRRPPKWSALEDKVAIEDFWRALGVSTAPARIVPVDAAALAAASRELDRGSGCVWAGDTRDGIHGGAELTRWIRSERSAAAARELFGRHCDHVRVMPFLEGIPCSIHGMVFPEGVAVFRPVEMVTLRRPQGGEFVYAGVATFWDPPPSDREAMRSLARRVGHGLRDELDYRGAFAIDGVLAEQGFLPTELNPRFGAGLQPISSALPGLPLLALSLAAVEGAALDYRPDWLEAIVVAEADRVRCGRGSLPLPAIRTETLTDRVVRDAGRVRFARPGEGGDGSFTIGPGAIGSFFNYAADPASLPSGSIFASRAIEAFALADREWGLEVGALEAARPVR